jgi:hypothetical protein
MLRVSRRTIGLWMKDGKLATIRPSAGVILIPMTSIHELLGDA